MCGPALQYTATATIGGTQQFQLVVDTGSGSLGVAGSTCSNCGVMPEYTPDSTATDEMQVCQASYGTGGWNGEIYQDNVALGPSMAVPVKFGSMTVQSTNPAFLNPGQTQCVAHPSGGGVQGIIGFGPTASSFAGTDGFWDVYAATEMVPDLFALKLCDTSGTLWLGGFDGAAVTAPPKFTPMMGGGFANTYYLMDFETITVGTGGTPIPVGSARTVTGRYGDQRLHPEHERLQPVIDCAQRRTQRRIHPGFELPHQRRLRSRAAEQGATRRDAPTAQADHGDRTRARSPSTRRRPIRTSISPAVRTGASASLGGNAGAAAVLGAPILKSNVVIWDRGNARIGFAPKTPCP